MASGTGWGLRLEGHVINPLGQVGALPLHLVLRLVNASTKLANLLFQRIHTRKQLSDEITAARGWRHVRDRRTAGRNVAASCTLILQYLHLTS